MEKPQNDLDDRLCDAFQSASDRIQEQTGITCFLCARILLVVETTFGLLAYKSWFGDLHWFFALLATLVCLGFLIGNVWVWHLERLCENSRWAKNPERLRLRDQRTANLLWIAIFFVAWLIWRNNGCILYCGYCAAYTAYRYFTTCTPLPPDLGNWVSQGA